MLGILLQILVLLHRKRAHLFYRDNKYVVVGLGEYLALRGAIIADKELRRLKNTTLGNARAILLIRGVPAQATQLIRDDRRMVEQQRAFVSESRLTNISIKNVVEAEGLVAHPGIRPLLHDLEDGVFGSIYASTSLYLENTLIPATTLSGAHAVIQILVPNFNVGKAQGSEEQWHHLLKDLLKCGKSVEAVFAKYRIDDSIPVSWAPTPARFPAMRCRWKASPGRRRLHLPTSRAWTPT